MTHCNYEMIIRNQYYKLLATRQTAAMTFEEEKMDIAYNSLKTTIKMCDVDSLYEGVIYKRPSQRCSTIERIERMIIWADSELFLAFLMFLKQSEFIFAQIPKSTFLKTTLFISYFS